MRIAFSLDGFKAKNITEKELRNIIDFFELALPTFVWSKQNDQYSFSTPIFLEKKDMFPSFKLRYGRQSIHTVRMERENMSGRETQVFLSVIQVPVSQCSVIIF